MIKEQASRLKTEGSEVISEVRKRIGDSSRANGKSTRIIDQAIQDLFTNGYAVVRDHYDTHKSNRILMDRMVKRLSSEHEGLKYKTIVENGAYLIALTK